jgi:hypothetical protein
VGPAVVFPFGPVHHKNHGRGTAEATRRAPSTLQLPLNGVEIMRLLLDRGADADALCDRYGGGNGATTLCLLVSSSHPAIAGTPAICTFSYREALAAPRTRLFPVWSADPLACPPPRMLAPAKPPNASCSPSQASRLCSPGARSGALSAFGAVARVRKRVCSGVDQRYQPPAAPSHLAGCTGVVMLGE